MINQDDLTARTQHARAFREHAFRIFYQRDHELADDTVEGGVLAADAAARRPFRKTGPQTASYIGAHCA
jgi:hypothetical protein